MSFSAQRIADVLSGFERGRVWVIGDVMLDEYLSGRVGRISPDAPVQVVQVEDTEYRLGGAANVANGIAALGGRVELLSVVGDDAAGRTLRALAEQERIGTRALVVEDRRQTIRKVRVVARQQHVLRLDWEVLSPVPSAVRNDAWERLRASEDPPDVIILSDYNKGLLSQEFNQTVVEWARPRGIPVLVDPKVLDFEHYAGATLVKPNRKEIEAALGQPVRDDPQWYDEHVRPLLDRAGLGGMLVTLGELGMALVRRDHDVIRIATRAREVYDVTGAGDTVISTLALSLAAGCEWGEAAEIANAAAGLAVAKVGTAIVTRAELAQALSPRRTLGATTPEALVEEIGWWRLQGKTIVFTNGCFDVLHIGHLELLRAAAAEGDVLVVGLNDDASVKRLKGDDRPLVPVAERAELLASLDCVDAVTVFSEDTPAALIERIQPDVLVKGGDYRPEDVVGRATVEARGGRVAIVPLVPGRSTSRLVEKLK